MKRSPSTDTPARLAKARWRHAEFIDFWARHFSRSYSWDRVLARVEAVQPASATASTLYLKANRNWRGGLAGQHVDLTVEIDGVRPGQQPSEDAAAVWRCGRTQPALWRADLAL
mgnify:CR=1 FL=1